MQGQFIYIYNTNVLYIFIKFLSKFMLEYHKNNNINFILINNINLNSFNKIVNILMEITFSNRRLLTL